MSSRNLQGNSIASKTLTSASIWTRNKWWPELPTVTESDQKFVGLHAVWPQGSNFLSFYIGGAAYGFYDVDFGDGYTQAIQNQSTRHYQFDYNSAALVGTEIPVSFVSSTNTVSKANHGYSNNQRIKFYNLSGSNLIDGQSYFVVNATTNEFQVSNVIGGSPITLTDGTGSLLPYRVAVVTITPRAGINLSHLDLQTKSTLGTLPNGYSSGWLDIALAGPLTTLLIGGTSSVSHALLERVNIVKATSISGTSLFQNCYSLEVITLASSTNLTSTGSMFLNCHALKQAPWFDTSAVTSAANMFSSCHSLTQVPLYDFSACTAMNGLFTNCYSLKTVPLFDTQNVTSMTGMFSGCNDLESVPHFNTTKVTSTQNMFSGCSSLKTVPPFDTQNVTSMSYMFNGCSSLETVPDFNTTKVTSMAYMFQNCYSLKTVPPFDTQNVTSMNTMFYSCRSLRYVPHFNTTKVTNMTSMFGLCTSLVSVPLFDTSSVTNVSSMFSSCGSLVQVPAFNLSSVSSASNMATFVTTGCTNLSSIKVTGVKYSWTVTNCKLSSSALDEIYTNLPTVASGTITVTGNWGTAGDTPNIAALKGWTVTGS